jgi:hypothetical protein
MYPEPTNTKIIGRAAVAMADHGSLALILER